ncbi:MAG: KpsF/GutQ family sugar-phosphate isomerase [Gammaproteobacteria bacterium]|nr:KpsF/GutQ family sugar-phosphate isomerase [Gammaproteobacteria bacterium]
MPLKPHNTKRNISPEALKELGKAVLITEAEAITALIPRIDTFFVLACEIMLQCEGRVVVTGMGKSGHIGGKIAATLASTGTPAFFVHSGEASHGDLGMITYKDVVLAISNSGETDELLTILPIIQRLDIPLISMTGNKESSLALSASVHIDVSVEKEACPLGLAPTASTTATLAMGDAMAVALLQTRGFTAENFAHSHPGGSLGRRLLVRVKDIMHTGEAIPEISDDASVSEALLEMTKKSLGFTTITNKEKHTVGIFTDGDLRRLLDIPRDFSKMKIKEVMIKNCMTVQSELLAAQALEVMRTKKLNAFPVIDANKKLIGALNMHDLLRAGFV